MIVSDHHFCLSIIVNFGWGHHYMRNLPLLGSISPFSHLLLVEFLTNFSDWRDIPFYSALSQGVISIEADVWLYNGTLHVGHEQGALTNERTFETLYINPILDVLKKQNPDSKFLPAPTHNGVFDTDAGQTLYLFVDLKTDGASTWPVVIKALEPL